MAMIRTAHLVQHELGGAMMALLAVATLGCADIRLSEPPTNFVLVTETAGHKHFKSHGSLGLHIVRFPNPEGGSLAFWTDELREKLGKRGYELTNTVEVESANGVPGLQLDFAVDLKLPDDPAGAQRYFYSAALFVTRDLRVVVQLAGEHDEAKARAQLPEVYGKLRI